MKLGFIGVGKIATSVIEGIFNAKINIREIILSPKNRQNANSLRNKFKKIKIAKSNQDVLDRSNWVVLSVTPKVGKQILKKLKFKKNNAKFKRKEIIENIIVSNQKICKELSFKFSKNDKIFKFLKKI